MPALMPAAVAVSPFNWQRLLDAQRREVPALMDGMLDEEREKRAGLPEVAQRQLSKGAMPEAQVRLLAPSPSHPCPAEWCDTGGDATCIQYGIINALLLGIDQTVSAKFVHWLTLCTGYVC